MKTGQYDVTIEPHRGNTTMLIQVTMRDCGCSMTTEAKSLEPLGAAVSVIEHMAARIASSHDCATS